MGFFKKDAKLSSQENTTQDSPPVIGPDDLSAVQALMDQWDTALGTNDRVWACLETFGRQGGYRGAEAVMNEAYRSGVAADVILQRPWRWLSESSRLAHSSGDNVLPGRIFLFMHLYASQMAPHMTMADELDTGVTLPSPENRAVIVGVAEQGLSAMNPDLLIHNTPSGQVSVGEALAMVRQAHG